MVTKAKVSFLLFVTLLMTLCLFTGTVFGKQVEGRGLWVVRYQITSPEKVKTLVNDAVENNFNFLVVQVVGRGDAFYNSDLLPRAKALKDQPADFDPLKMTIELAHKKGIKVIAWLNDMYAAPFGANLTNTDHILAEHPDWVTYHYKGKSLIEMGQDENGPEIEGLFLEPGLEGVKEHIVARYKEIVLKYDVDGVHHDYVRYSNPNLGYHPVNRKAFQTKYGVDPVDLRINSRAVKKEVGIKKYYELRKKWDQFRRDMVTEVVKAVYQGVKTIEPEVEVSAAVVGYYDDARDNKFQDWKHWLEEGYLDVAMPMIYESQDSIVEYMIDTALEMEGQGVVFPGLGAYNMLDNPESLVKKVKYAREAGAKGVLFFSYGAIARTDGYFEILKESLFPQEAEYPETVK